MADAYRGRVVHNKRSAKGKKSGPILYVPRTVVSSTKNCSNNRGFRFKVGFDSDRKNSKKLQKQQLRLPHSQRRTRGPKRPHGQPAKAGTPKRAPNQGKAQNDSNQSRPQGQLRQSRWPRCPWRRSIRVLRCVFPKRSANASNAIAHPTNYMFLPGSCDFELVLSRFGLF